MPEPGPATRRRYLSAAASLPLLAGCLGFGTEDYRLTVINHSERPLDALHVEIETSEVVFDRTFSLSTEEARELSGVAPPKPATLRVNGPSIELPVETTISPNNCTEPEVYVTVRSPSEVDVQENRC